MNNQEIDLTLGKRLQEYWRASEVPTLCAPSSLNDLRHFEEANGILLPKDFRGYLHCVNGFSQSESYQDDRGFNFWPLEKLSRLADYDGAKYHFLDDAGYFIFCDYLDFCWAYAVSLNSPGSKVVLIGTKDGRPKSVATNFSEFVDLYLNDDERLYA